MWGTIVNSAAIIAGGLIGTFFNKSLPKRFQTIVFQAMGLCTIVIGISMALKMDYMLFCVLSLLAGGLLGELLKLDAQIDKLSSRVKRIVKIKNDRFSEGFISTSLLFCVGAMAILGAVEEGSGQYPNLLLTKSVMDGFSSIAFGAAFGIAVIFSSIPVFIYQGLLTFLVILFGNLLSEAIINEVSAVGGVLLIGLGINLLEVVRIKIVNLLPALIFVGALVWLFA
ncbi:MAG: DUF554 domain-containing protein [Prevotellaceae bacterium]|jgi:uncharacterized membrane protein YqgA involved in biofilm formation|nr:DUF554 domain-containing protein [Prevotellaceae bacterium]